VSKQQDQAATSTDATRLPSVDGGCSQYFPSVQDSLAKLENVFPRPFTGAKASVSKMLSDNFQVTHSLKIPTTPSDNESYRFGAIYVGNAKNFGPGENYPLLMGETDARGNTTALMMHQFGDRLRLKYRQQFSKDPSGSGVELMAEHRGEKTHLGISLHEPDLLNLCGGYSLSCMRSVYGGLDMGVMIGGCYNLLDMQVQHASTKYLARYSNPKWTATGMMGDNSLSLAYHQKIDKDLELALGFDANGRDGSTARIGCQMQLPDNSVVFRASYDSEWNASAVLEKRLSTVPYIPPATLTLSGVLNHASKKASFGIGFSVGG